MSQKETANVSSASNIPEYWDDEEVTPSVTSQFTSSETSLVPILVTKQVVSSETKKDSMACVVKPQDSPYESIYRIIASSKGCIDNDSSDDEDDDSEEENKKKSKNKRISHNPTHEEVLALCQKVEKEKKKRDAKRLLRRANNNLCTAEYWKSVEERVSQRELDVLMALTKYITNKNNNNFKVLGDTDFDYLQAYMSGTNIKNQLQNQMKDFNQKNKTSYMNTHKTLEKLALDLTKNPFQYLTSVIVEARIVALLYYINDANKEKGMFSAKALELLVGVETFLNTCVNLTAKTLHDSTKNGTIATKAIDLLVTEIKKLRSKFGYDDPKKYINDIFEKCPQLLFVNIFKKCSIVDTIVPYLWQKNVINFSKNNINVPFFTEITAMIANGKTTLAVALAICFGERHKKFIFCARPSTVRLNVARSMYSLEHGKLGILLKDANGRSSVKYQSFASKDKCYMLIGDVEATTAYLRSLSKEDAESHVLFFDEPNIGSHDSESKEIKELSELLLNIPSQTFFSSATMPHMDFKKVQESWEVRHNSAFPQVTTFTSDEVFIGCNITTLDGSEVCVFEECKNNSSLKVLIDNLEKQPLFRRFLTHKEALFLSTLVSEEKMGFNTNFVEIFSKAENINFNAVTQYSLKVLKEIANAGFTDDKISKIFGKRQRHTFEKVDMQKLCVNSKLLSDNTIIGSSDPMSSKSLFKEHLDSISCESKYFDKLVSQHLKKVHEYDSQIEKLNNVLTKKSTDKARAEEIRNELKSFCKPTICFPEKFQLGTKAHQKENKLANNTCRNSSDFQNIPLDTTMPDEYMTLLLSGVGVSSSNITDEKYTKVVTSMTLKGLLPYLITDVETSYGTNAPFTNVIIDDPNFITKYGWMSFFQLVGRTGRGVGNAFTSTACIESSIAKNLVALLYGDSISNMESTNIKASLDNVFEKTQSKFEHQLSNKKECEKMQASMQQDMMIDKAYTEELAKKKTLEVCSEYTNNSYCSNNNRSKNQYSSSSSSSSSSSYSSSSSSYSSSSSSSSSSSTSLNNNSWNGTTAGKVYYNSQAVTNMTENSNWRAKQ